jgi:hypothetical protein
MHLFTPENGLVKEEADKWQRKWQKWQPTLKLQTNQVVARVGL